MPFPFPPFCYRYPKRKKSKIKSVFVIGVAFESLLVSAADRTGRKVRHLEVKRTNVAYRLPHGKRAAWNGN
ncbi:hypothetical protein [Fictibacillus sp. 18YEL24]|uniref:hypothetical protein n=1 Tax=Fictibacillus sp. 18YEL24 TaxID=2745875 RepID=UPI0018CDD243|nr:hypothetical protein [Fictibacillus sp. 18YEL24]MBH0170042.1 hypothetical protein [Fictibacillus sp. 18YEL24]